MENAHLGACSNTIYSQLYHCGNSRPLLDTGQKIKDVKKPFNMISGKIIWSESKWKDNLKDGVPDTCKRNKHVHRPSQGLLLGMCVTQGTHVLVPQYRYRLCSPSSPLGLIKPMPKGLPSPITPTPQTDVVTALASSSCHCCFRKKQIDKCWFLFHYTSFILSAIFMNWKYQ